MKYFKCKHENTILPLASLQEPNSLLKKGVSLKAIELVNAEAIKLKETRPHGRGPYLYLTGVQRYKVGKRTAEYVTR